jgi:hypothetical protein
MIRLRNFRNFRTGCGGVISHVHELGYEIRSIMGVKLARTEIYRSVQTVQQKGMIVKINIPIASLKATELRSPVYSSFARS